ncbi:hypothetical protein THARTR1_01247 [Trichoderma harzianum]|uniref:Nephrocystin 3-like N-terminal domain-containing protein n=1 Tax=Trichoderma harzianum TaxID=5544 RepID=A0A2K0UMJ5_TRIHA|nr:hypothetical protein THARTR1_01247 [Trichoderma harzianum]
MSTDHHHGAAAHSSQESVLMLRRLVEALPDEYQEAFRKCTTGEEVLKDLQDYGTAWNTRNRRLGIFIRVMKPFFTAMDVFVSCDPMHAATLWGALRVVIALGITFHEFLDKVTSGLEKLAVEIEYLDELSSIFGELERKRYQEMDDIINAELNKRMKEGWLEQELTDKRDQMREELSTVAQTAIQQDYEQLTKSSPRTQVLLQDMFEEILQFLMGVFRMFYHPDGNDAVRVVAKTVWHPFRFDETISRMKELKERMKMEIVLLNLKLSKDAKDIAEASKLEAVAESTRAKARGDKLDKSMSRLEQMAEKEARYTFLHRVREWLDPPSFADRYEDVASQCMPGTTSWLLEHTIFRSWLQDGKKASGGSLWVRGNPGSGKSVLAASTIQELKGLGSSNPVCYFFFNSTQDIIPNTSSTAYRALLSQILQYRINDNQMRETLEFAMYFQSPGQKTASKKEIDDLMELCLHSDDNIYLVLDGLDECEDSRELVEKLRRLTDQETTRLALFCRPTLTWLSKRISSLQIISIDLSNKDDIRHYLRQSLKDMKSEGLLSKSLDYKEVAKTLTRRADGMFLWARLMVTYLNSPALYPAQRTQAISEMDNPEGLEVMYERILHLIEGSNKAMHRLAGQSFLWLSYGKRPLIPAELESGLVPFDADPNEEEAWKLPEFEDVIVRAFGGLVELSPKSIEFLGNTFRPLRFIHASVKEYFANTESTSKNGLIPPPPLIAHARLATMCLKYLTYRVPSQPLSGRLGNNVVPKDLWSAFPFSNYAMVRWTSHLVLTIQGSYNGEAKPELEVLFSALKQFFTQPNVLMAYIEGCYTYGEAPNAKSLRLWAERSSLDILSNPEADIRATIVEFSHFLEKLESDWGRTLRNNPASIWEEVTAFTPSPLLPKHGGISVRSLVPAPSTKAGLSKKPINRLTQVTSDGLYHVVLGVYTSEKFERHDNKTRADKLCEDKSFSQGWIVRYEISQLSDQQVVASLEIPLPEFDVWTRLCETLLRGSIQIPISISRDSRFFTVMRNLYHVKLEGNKLRYATHSLPIELDIFGNTEHKSQGYQKFLEELTYKDFSRYYKDNLRRVSLYWIYLDDYGENLCYASQERAAPAHLRVFKISVSSFNEVKIETTKVAERQFWAKGISTVYEDRDDKEFEMCFHPFLPVLVYAGAKGTYVWNFNTNMSQKVGHGAADVAFLSCSETGESCILTPRGQRPEIIPIQSALAATGILEEDLRPKLKDDEDTEQLVLSDGAMMAPPDDDRLITKDWTLTHAMSGHGKPLTSSNMIVGPSGIIKHVSVVNSGLTTSLHLWNKDGRDESMVLTRFPNYEGADSAKVSVIRSLNEDEPVQIIVDKSADTWSKITRAEPAVFPVMVERDIRSFSTQTTINGSPRSDHAALPGIVEGDIQGSSAQTSVDANLVAADRSSEMPQTMPAGPSMQDERDVQNYMNWRDDNVEKSKNNERRSRLRRFLGKMKCL